MPEGGSGRRSNCGLKYQNIGQVKVLRRQDWRMTSGTARRRNDHRAIAGIVQEQNAVSAIQEFPEIPMIENSEPSGKRRLLTTKISAPRLRSDLVLRTSLINA